MAGLTDATIKKLKVNELKAELSKRGLAVKGKKDDLVKRLIEALEEEEEEEVEEEVDGSGEEEEPMEDDGQDSAVGTSQEESEAETASQEEKAEEEADESDEQNEKESKAPDSSCDVETSDDFVVVTKPADDVAGEVEKGAEAQDAVVEEQEVTEGTGESVETPMEVAKDAAVEEQEVTEGTGETPMDVPETPADVSQSSKDSPKKTPKKSPKKSPKKDVVSSSEKEPEGKSGKEKEVKESPRKSRSERDSKDKDKVVKDSKSGEKEVKDKDKEVKKDQEKDSKKEPEVKKEPEIPDVLTVVEDEEGEIPEVFEAQDGHVLLDPYMTDLNFVISNKGTTGHSLTKNGFTFMWAGSRGNKGAKGGKIGYELKVVGLTPTDLATNEAPHNAVRIGWSSEYASLQLGESSLSYGFESTGKVCASSSFFEYGEKFTEGDVIGTYLDLESEPKTLRYTKNGEDLGVAMSLTVNLEEKPLFPHVYLRNMKVELNFGGNDEPWFPTLEGYSLLQNSGAENIADRTSEAPAEFSDCEVILMVGLPSSGKTSWVKKYVDTHPKKHFNVFGVKQVMDRCKLEGRSRKKSDANSDKLNKAIITILTKLYQLCSKSKRNYIFDQTNVYKIGQEMKMTAFKEFKRKAVLIIPVHEVLRKRTSESKRRGDNLVEIPFGDLCDMKCEFHLPEVGDFFEEIVFTEQDEKNAANTIRDYHIDGSRAKRTGRDEQYGSKRKRYDEQRSSYEGRRDNRLSGSGGRHEGWKGSSSGGGYGGYDKGRSYQPSYGGNPGGYKPGNKASYDPYRRNSGGSSGGYRQQSSYGGGNTGGGGYRGNNNYNTSSYGGSNNYGNQQWNSQYQNTQNQQWGSTNWGNYNNSSSYNSNSGNYRGGGGGYSY